MDFRRSSGSTITTGRGASRRSPRVAARRPTRARESGCPCVLVPPGRRTPRGRAPPSQERDEPAHGAREPVRSAPVHRLREVKGVDPAAEQIGQDIGCRPARLEHAGVEDLPGRAAVRATRPAFRRASRTCSPRESACPRRRMRPRPVGRRPRRSGPPGGRDPLDDQREAARGADRARGVERQPRFAQPARRARARRAPARRTRPAAPRTRSRGGAPQPRVAFASGFFGAVPGAGGASAVEPAPRERIASSSRCLKYAPPRRGPSSGRARSSRRAR